MCDLALIRNGLRENARELQKIREQLLELRRMVPPPREPLDEDAEPDPLPVMRAIIECGLQDRLEPLIQDLLAAADRWTGQRG
jgi:hypothetical protein